MSVILSSPRYSMHEVARLLRVHVATIWRWHLHGVRGRKLPTVLVGGRRFVLADDLAAFLANDNPSHSATPSDLHQRADAAGRLLDAHGVRTKEQPASLTENKTKAG